MSNHLTGGPPATPPPLAKVCHLVFVACPIERCAVWEGERAVHRYAVETDVSLRECCVLAPSECSIWFLCPSSFGSARVSCPGLRF